MRVTLSSGTPAALAKAGGEPIMGLVIATDIFGLRPLFDDMVDAIAAEQQMTVCAPEPFPGQELPFEVEARYRAVGQLRDADVLRDLVEAADATGCDRVSTQRGVIITGRRDTRWRSISKDALPSPMIIAART